MALRMLPPCHDARRASSSAMASRTMRTSILLALPRPAEISRPECPPFSPFTVRRTATSSLSVSSSLYSSVAVMSTPPALPIISSPSSSVSRLSSISPSSSPAGRSLAPYIPVSSSAVISASMGPCFRSVDSITAIIAATPRPSSAPRVVPFAFTQSPSM